MGNIDNELQRSLGKYCLGYLSGAPRVSTRSQGETGGPRSHILGVIHAFKQFNWQVISFIVGDHLPMTWTSKQRQEKVRRNVGSKLIADLVRLFLGLINSYRAWHQLGYKVDMVYERSAVLQAMGWMFKRHGIYWIVETSALNYYEAKVERDILILSRLAKWIELKAYRQCDLLICISDSLKELIVREGNISPQKIVVIPNGVDTTFFDPNQYSAIRLFDGFVIGFVGRLLVWQGIDTLINALYSLKQQGLNVNLVVVGDGLARLELEKKVRELSLQFSVAFTGQVPREDVPRYIAGFDIGYSGQIPLQIGKMYHSPLKLYEYLAMQKPVIASNFSDAQELLSQAQVGFLFEAGNEVSLRQAVMQAYESREQLLSMGILAREIVKSKYSWRARMTPLINDLEKVLLSDQT